MNLCPRCSKKLDIDKVDDIIFISCPHCGVESYIPGNTNMKIAFSNFSTLVIFLDMPEKLKNWEIHNGRLNLHKLQVCFPN